MKLSSAILLASVGATAAFAPQPSSRAAAVTSIQMSDGPLSDVPVAVVEPELAAMSQSLPFMARPDALDGSLAGDVGFDPLGFAKSKDDLMRYREAEVKHAVRLRMHLCYVCRSMPRREA